MSRRWGPPPNRRPPWWPADRPWPPQGRWGGRGGPPSFVWRFGCLVLIAMFVVAGFVAAIVGGISAHFGWVAALAFVGVTFLLLAIVASQGLRRFARPMDDLIDAAGRIERGDYSARIREGGPRQLRSVARAFNSMSARLKATDERRRDFLADVVHELRTPLAVIRAEAEAIQDGVHLADREHLAPIIDATRSLEILCEDLRALALSDTGSLALNREIVDPSELAQDVVGSFAAQAEAAGVRLTLQAADGLMPVDVDPVRIRGAVGNLIANAIRHTPAGGSVTLGLYTAAEGVVLEVVDTGDGIAPDLLPRVFERFVRGPGSTGSGLGLAIAHDIVVAHGGSIDIQSRVGAGTKVRMMLPVAAASG